MNPLHPRDAFGTRHVVALVLLGIDALAQDIRAAAHQGPQATHSTPPDDFDLALLGLCVLGDRVRSLAGDDETTTPTATRHRGQVLR